jgi:hypothetical protein
VLGATSNCDVEVRHSAENRRNGDGRRAVERIIRANLFRSPARMLSGGPLVARCQSPARRRTNRLTLCRHVLAGQLASTGFITRRTDNSEIRKCGPKVRTAAR